MQSFGLVAGFAVVCTFREHMCLCLCYIKEYCGHAFPATFAALKGSGSIAAQLIESQ